MLIEATPGSLIFSAAATVLVAGGLWGIIPTSWLMAWVGYMLGVSVARFLHVHWFQNSGRGRPNIERFKNWYVVGVVYAGVGWGISGALLFAPDEVIHQSLLAVVLAGVTAAAVAVYAPVTAAVRYFVALSLAPLACVHILIGSQTHIIMGALICGYGLFLLRLATVVHRSISTTLGLRYDNEDLINELTSAKLQADEINDRLKREIGVRSETEAQLLEAVDKAEQAARAKSEFLATMSHEIRTPMNGVLGMTELLMNTSLTPKRFRFADTIRRSGKALLAIINDILDFSKIEAGKLDIQHTVFDLRQLVEDSMGVFAEQAHGKGVELILQFPPDEHAAYRGDPDRTRQILLNLIGNAVKFTERGEISLRVQSLDVATDLATLRFEAVDSGIGIPPEHQYHIFESFQQADGATTRKFGGTGLGLAICNRLVQLMHGKIGVESRPGKGSAFWFTTKMSRMPADSIAGQIKHAGELSGLSVLIVDDNETTRTVLEQQLSNWRMRTDSATSAAAAVRKLKESAARGEPFALTILDGQMPGVGGVELAREIKRDALLENTRIIMLSSVNELENTGQWHLAGIDMYVHKPVRRVELFDAISNTMPDASAVTTSQPAPPSVGEPDEELNAHVLLAEDNPVNQELASAMLDAMGCTSVIAGNGREAVTAVTDAPLDAIRKPYDAILMDCQMPEMDGYQATRQIRRWEQEHGTRDPIPIIALTANALEGDRDKCIGAGMNDYLTKPFTQARLTALIKRWAKLSVEAGTATDGSGRAVPEPAAAGHRSVADLDQRALDNIRALQSQGSPNILQKIIDMFISNSPQQLEKLEEAATTGNADLLRSAAHSLKSSSANLGATEMSAMCSELEKMGLHKELEGVVSKVGVLEFEFEAVCETLTSLAAGEAA